MKLTTLIILSACLQVSAKTAAQNVSLSVKNEPLAKVFRLLKAQSGYQFFYNETLLNKAHPVTVEVKNQPLEKALQLCFEGQPLTFAIIEKNVVVKEKELQKTEVSPNENLNAPPPPPTEITGRIMNEQGEPLASASVIIKRTGYGTVTASNGTFSFSPKDLGNEDVLEVSFIGYATQSFKIGTRTNFNTSLKPATNELDETIIQAYGKTSRRLATGNIAKVSSEEIEKQPVMNPMLALEGKVAGLEITQRNGYASAPVKIELRGRSNINPNLTSDPFFIVDGVPLTVLDISNNLNYTSGSSGFLQSGNRGPAGGQSPFFNIDPADIESIEILKDADATAIYGSRGANGVILITTKKGNAGKTKFNLRVQEGITKVTGYYQMMNTQQYLAMRLEALKNDGITPSLANGDFDILQWDTTKYTDWQKAMYGGSGRDIDVQAGLSGGNSQTTFRIGAGYNHVTNFLTVGGADQRASISFNLNHHSIDQRFMVSFTSAYSYTQSDMINFPFLALTAAPNAPAIYDSAGNLNYAGWGGSNSMARAAYPFSNLKQPYVAKTNFLNSNLSIGYQPIKGLKISANFGYNNAQANQQTVQTIASLDPFSNPLPAGNSTLNFNSNKNWIIEPQATYDVVAGKGKLSALIGGTEQQTNTDGTNISGTGYTSDILINSISSALTRSGSDFHGEYKYEAVFGRVSYNLQNKYIFNVTARRDGSSRFGEGKQFGNFGALGGAWIFTEEPWLKDHIPFLSFGKLRGSYGLTGSDAVGDYKYLTRLSSTGTQPYSGTPSLIPTQLANSDFHWSTNKKLEAALDLGFLKDRINLSIVYYRNRCGDQLVNFPTPALSGFTSVVANSPALVQNDGWEFTGGAKLIDGKNFKWSLNFNMAINHNKLVDYPNFALSPYLGNYIIGQPLNIVKLLHYTGVDPQTGLYTFEDRNHDGQISVNHSNLSLSDDGFVQNLAPKFFGGLGMNFSYKNLNLSLFFNFKKQVGSNSLYQIYYGAGTQGINEPAALIGQEWKQPGDKATIAKFSTLNLDASYYNFQGGSDAAYTDASFIRLSNVAFSYSLPTAWLKKAGMQGCNLFLNVNNLFTITKYQGPDPESQNFGGLPPTKTIVAGINFNF